MSSLNQSLTKTQAQSFLVNHMPSGYAYFKVIQSETDPSNFKFLSVNQAFNTLLGVNNVEGKYLSEIFPNIATNHPQLIAGVEQTLSQGTATLIEYFQEFSKWLEISMIALVDDEIICYFKDITTLKEAEENLLATERRYATLFENMDEGYTLYKIIKDGAGIPVDAILLEANTAYEKHTGLRLNDVLGKTMVDIYPLTAPSQIPKYAEVAFGGPSYEYELHSIDLQRYYRIRVVSPGDGLFSLLFEDVTDRKLKEIELIEDEEYFRKMFEVHDVVQIIVDPMDGRVINANKAAELFYGWTHEELCTKNIKQINTSASENVEALMESIVKKTQDHFSITHYKADGSLAFVDVHSCAIHRGGKEYLHSFIIDRSQEELSRNNLIMSEEKLRAANVEKDKFFSILAHDLRSPFATFSMAMDLLSTSLDNFTLDEINSHLTGLLKSAKRMNRLLDDLLEWANLQRGILKSKPTRVNLAMLVKESIADFDSIVEHKNISISLLANDYLIAYVDKNMVKTVIRNLLSNAVKYSARGGKVSITVDADDNSKILVSVEDWGVGMSKEILDSLFSLTETICRKGTENESSSGLGLVLCKEFVEINGGTIWAISEEGQGSTFSFTLPEAEYI